MKIDCAHDAIVPIDSLKAHPRNTNEHPEKQIEYFVKVLDYQGQRKAVVVSNLSKCITKGHGLVLAAKAKGEREIAVDYQDYEDEAQEYADIEADNQLARLAVHNHELMIQNVLELKLDTNGFDLDLLGIPDLDLSMPDPSKDAIEDDVPEPTKSISKLGDIYELGEHRLMCGDSTDIGAVERLMNGEKADMAFTDPPYGVNYSGGIQFTSEGVKKDQRKKLENDHSSEIYRDTLPLLSAFTDGPIYVWYAASEGRHLYEAISELGEYHAMIVWVKDGGYGALNACYKQKHEPCVFWKPKGSTLRWAGPTTENTIWEMKKDKNNKLHPTQKPVELPERAIKNHEAKSVLDLFGGSGSTLIACEKTKRKCFMMELDPHYVDVIVSRYVKYSGKTSIKRNGEPMEWTI